MVRSSHTIGLWVVIVYRMILDAYGWVGERHDIVFVGPFQNAGGFSFLLMVCLVGL